MRYVAVGFVGVVLAGAVAAHAATTRDLVRFTVGSRAAPDERFVIATDDPDLVAAARAELALPAGERRLFPVGRLAAGDGGFNLGYRWHLAPDGLELVETTVEVCDGVPSTVESDLAYWLGTVATFCPRSGYLVAEGGQRPAARADDVTVTLQEVVGGLQRPVGVTAADDGSGRLFVVEQGGRIRLVSGGRVEPMPYLDLSAGVGSAGNEQGLLGLAFAPDFATSGRLYVDYTDRDGDTVVARLTATPSSADEVDPATEEVLLTIPQPYSNHNGGDLAFGPDGMLWIGAGDGGSAGDPEGNGQDPSTLLGALLRVDVSGDAGYAVPADNPFADDPAARGEVWAFGLRNPWRFSFDRATGDLYVADVGQSRFEEVDVIGAADPGGRNLGWNVMEGFDCYQSDQCDRSGLTLPAATYSHAEGCSVTGGAVYRGAVEPELAGHYLFADFCSGRIWALVPGGASGWAVAEVGHHDGALAAFGEDEAGELYAVDLAAGTLLQVTADPVVPAPRRPAGRLGD